MTALLNQAFNQAKSLTEGEQNAIAMIILEALEDEARWEKAFSKSHDVLTKLAKEAMEEDARGETVELNPDSL